MARQCTLEDCARDIGVDPAHLSRFERGLASLSIDKLVRLAEVLDYRPVYETLAGLVRGGRAQR
jgi:transcriptional regulator with XRE-family HTH domain